MPATALTLDESIFHRLTMASLAVREYRNLIYRARYDLNIAEWQILLSIYEHGPSVQRQLAERNKLHKVIISRAVVKIIRRGLLNRVRHNWDGRSQYLVLTTTGEELCRRIVADAIVTEKQLLRDFTCSEAVVLTAWLARIEKRTLRILSPPSQAPCESTERFMTCL